MGGVGAHTRSRPWSGFTLVCAHSGAGGGSRAAQPEHGVHGASVALLGLPAAPGSCRDGGWKGGFASRPATRVLSPEESQELLGRWAAPSGHAQLVLRPSSVLPGMLRGGTAPRRSVPASCSSLAGDFHKPHLSLFLLWSCLGSRLAHCDFSHRAWQGGLVISKPWLVCS